VTRHKSENQGFVVFHTSLQVTQNVSPTTNDGLRGRQKQFRTPLGDSQLQNRLKTLGKNPKTFKTDAQLPSGG